MRKILLSSHGELAKGMANTLRFFVGDLPELDFICAYTDDIPFEEKLKDYFDRVPEGTEVVVFTDLLGGSVNAKFLQYMNAHPLSKIHLVANMSLGLVLEAVMLTENESFSEEIERILEKTRADTVYLNRHRISSGPEDEL